jgi:hypothetical protein
MWYMTAKPRHVSVLCIRVRDLGKAEWSHRRYTGLAFRKVSIFPASREHLTLAMTSMVRHAAQGSQAAQSALGPINRGLPTIRTTCNHVYELFFIE